MSWRFAGISTKRELPPETLPAALEVKYQQSADNFTFSDAIGRENQATGVGHVNGRTLLLHHHLPYDCSYEPRVVGRLDAALARLSDDGEVLSYVFDGVSGTYCLAVFSGGACVRRWAVMPGQVLCDEGAPVAGESGEVAAALTASAAALPATFAMPPDEARAFAVWEAFTGVSFQALVQDEQPCFRFFL